MLFSPIVLVVLGLALAFAGRRFIWLVIGVAGFVLGYQLVAYFVPDQAVLVQLIVGLVVGVIFAALASKFAKILLMVAGFILVGNAALQIGLAFNIQGGFLQFLIFVVGGLIGLGLIRFAFNWAIILISAIGGAAMVTQGLPALLSTQPGTLNLILGVVVAVAGFIVQARVLRDDPKTAA